MQCLTKATLLGVGLLTSSAALADDYYGASSAYYPPYSPYYSSYTQYPYNYPSYGYSYPAYSYSYLYPPYGGYPGTTYARPQTSWAPRNPWQPYSPANANWVPYVG